MHLSETCVYLTLITGITVSFHLCFLLVTVLSATTVKSLYEKTHVLLLVKHVRL